MSYIRTSLKVRKTLNDQMDLWNNIRVTDNLLQESLRLFLSMMDISIATRLSTL